MDVLESYLKDPQATDRYALDWTDRLAAQGVAASGIVDFYVTVPAGLAEAYRLRTDAVTAVWLGGGTLGQAYMVTFGLRLRHPAGVGEPIVWERSIRVTVADQ